MGGLMETFGGGRDGRGGGGECPHFEFGHWVRTAADLPTLTCSFHVVQVWCNNASRKHKFICAKNGRLSVAFSVHVFIDFL
jgi:hypothetical protein